MTMTLTENVILDGGTLQKEVESLLRRYRPLGQPWVSAKLKLTFNEGRIELYSVVQRLSEPTRTSLRSESASGPGPEVARNAAVSTDSTSQNHEPCPKAQTQTDSSPEVYTNIFQPEMETENAPEIGNEMPGEESMTCTTFPVDDVKKNVPTSLPKKRSEGVRDFRETGDNEDGDSNYEPDCSDGTDKDSEDEPMTNLAISNVRSLSESAVQSDTSPSKKRARGDSSESEGDDADSNYEPDSSDETDKDSEDEPMTNLATSNVRTLPESAVPTSISKFSNQNPRDRNGLDGQGILNASKKIKNPCKICGKGFYCPSTLRRHISSIHERERTGPGGQFECKECGNTYKEGYTLTRHMRIHMADCPFRCNLCKRPFISKVDLERHVRTHTGERPFQCPTCSKGYRRKHSLTFHRCAS